MSSHWKLPLNTELFLLCWPRVTFLGPRIMTYVLLVCAPGEPFPNNLDPPKEFLERLVPRNSFGGNKEKLQSDVPNRIMQWKSGLFLAPTTDGLW